MATAKKAVSEKHKRDYAAERERTKLNKQKQEAGNTDASEKPKQPVKATPMPATGQNIDMGVCGHINVALSQIVSDPNQPRKFFDMEELMGLSKSIIQYGVIEPILVRPIAGELYMVVFGDRRFRASLLAQEAGNDITEIPAMIREIADDEALELQITENLQRHDPHPIEEAHSFKMMLAKHSVEEIALRFSKSEKFVAMRLMLNDLSPKFQELFFANKMSLGQAVKICKVAIEAQDAIFSDEVPDNWKEDSEFMLDDIERLVNRETKNLDSAPFKTEDAEIYPEMGACGKCPYNSANTLQLFVEEQKGRICGNAVCYNIKCVRAYKANIEEVMTDPSVVFVAGSYYIEEAKQKIKDVEKIGVKVLDQGTYAIVGPQDEKPEWDKYIVKREEDFNHDEISEEDYINAIKPEFEQEVAEWESEHNELVELRNAGRVKKAFIVAGNGEGKFVEVIATTPQAELILGTSGNAEDGSDPAIAIQIAEIEKRENRNKELDGEKVWQAVRTAIGANDFIEFAKDDKLKPIERSAFAIAIFSSLGYEDRNHFIESILEVETEDTEGIDIAKAFEKINDQEFNLLCRMFMKSKIFPLPGSHLKSYTNYMGHAVAKLYLPESVKNIEAEIAVKAEQRAQKVAKKIEDLKEPTQP